MRDDLPARFEGRILDIDSTVADAWGTLMARSDRADRRMLAMHAFLAGTAQSVISRLEQAGRLPTLEVLGRVAAATGADVRLLARHTGGVDADVRISASLPRV